jgi:hypothetical protein
VAVCCAIGRDHDASYQDTFVYRAQLVAHNRAMVVSTTASCLREGHTMKFYACALSRLSSEPVPDPVDSMAVSFIDQYDIKSCNQERRRTGRTGW